MSPALTKPTDITDVAVEDWINAVIPAPTRTPIILFPVSFARTLFNFSPAIACKLPLVILTLYRNKAIPEQSPNNAGHTSAIKIMPPTGYPKNTLPLIHPTIIFI